ANRIPLLEGALECVRAGHIPGGLKANREFAECVVQYANGVADDLKTLLFDPQTAGGLLAAVAADKSDDLLKALIQAGVLAVHIGAIEYSNKPSIRVET
ncbi:MAG TPA: selenide, water dikinase SelD, partial [Terriglobales bacterium]|nr:selenide, water dikinase SelD [Terriglobales bacterium]